MTQWPGAPVSRPEQDDSGGWPGAVAERPRQYSGGEVWLDNFGDSLTFGLGNRIGAAFDGAGAALNGGSFGDTYSRRVRESLDRLREGAEQHPDSAMQGQLSGFVPWMFVPIGGEAAAGRLGVGALRNAPLLSRLAQGAGRALTMDFLPGSAQLANAARGGGAGAAAAQYGRAAYTGAGYGALNSITHSDPGHELDVNTVAPGAIAGAIGGATFRGLGTIVGSHNPLLRMGTGGAVGAALGAGGAAVSGEDVLHGAEAGALGGTALGAVARPSLLGWATSRNPGVRVASGALVGGGLGYGTALWDNSNALYADDLVDPMERARDYAGIGALAGFGLRQVQRLRRGDDGRPLSPNEENAFRFHRDRATSQAAAHASSGGIERNLHNALNVLRGNHAGLARDLLTGRASSETLRALRNMNLNTPSGRAAFRALRRELARARHERSQRALLAPTWGIGAGGAGGSVGGDAWDQVRDALTWGLTDDSDEGDKGDDSAWPGEPIEGDYEVVN